MALRKFLMTKEIYKRFHIANPHGNDARLKHIQKHLRLLSLKKIYPLKYEHEVLNYFVDPKPFS